MHRRSSDSPRVSDAAEIRQQEEEEMDLELFASVIECVSAAANRPGVALPTRKQAGIMAEVYDRWRATGAPRPPVRRSIGCVGASGEERERAKTGK